MWMRLQQTLLWASLVGSSPAWMEDSESLVGLKQNFDLQFRVHNTKQTKMLNVQKVLLIKFNSSYYRNGFIYFMYTLWKISKNSVNTLCFISHVKGSRCYKFAYDVNDDNMFFPFSDHIVWYNANLTANRVSLWIDEWSSCSWMKNETIISIFKSVKLSLYYKSWSAIIKL